MEEFFFKISNKKIKITEESLKRGEIKNADYKNIKRGNIEDIYKYSFPEENFVDFYVNDHEKKFRILKLTTYRYSPEGNPKALIIIFHGMNAHINHAAYNAKQLADQGYLVVGYDHRGFGKSQGLRGYIDTVDILYSDAKTFVAMMVTMFPNMPIFLMGLSMGSLISYKLCLEFPNEFKGVILLSPALRPIQKGFFVGFGVFLGWIMSKPQTVKPKIDFAVKSEYVKEKLINDPYTYNEGTRLGTLKAILQGMDDIDKSFKKFKTPFVAVVGGKDAIVDISASFELVDQSLIKDKQLWYYEDLYHDIWNEEELFDICPKIVDWINERSKN